MLTEPHGALLDRCLRGDRRAQYQVYNLYAKAMYNVSYRILQQTQEAEDVLQEAFLDAFLKLSTFRRESSFGAWLKQIVVRKAINQLRTRREVLFSIDSPAAQEVDLGEDTEFWESTDSLEPILQALSRLPEGYRTVLSLYLFEGYDHEEISQILGISEVTSRTQYVRAKKRLMEMIQNRTVS
ncbi:MAG: RNA polymerase sigma factor [Spirosomataceae bacterium]